MIETPRKRLDDTLNHRDPGKVVVDMGSTSVTGINANALAALRNALGLEKKPIKVYEPFQLLGMVEDDLRQVLGLCVAEVSNNYTLFGYENKNLKPWKLPSSLDVLVGEGFVTSKDKKTGYTYVHPQGNIKAPPSGRLPPSGFYFDNCFRTFREFDEDKYNGRKDYIEDYKVYTDEQLRTIENNCNNLFNNTDLGIIGGGMLAGLGDYAFIPGPHIPFPKGIRRIEDWICIHKTHPDYIHQVFSLQIEVALENARLFWQACGDKVQVIQISGTDFGTQRAPIMSNDTFREFYKPYYKQINSWIHQNTNWKTFFHCCGSIIDLMEEFHEAGVDILNPVQCSAAGMDPKILKEKWGDKFVFWGGGVNTQQTLPFGTPEEVRKEVLERCRIFSPGGGFVFNPTHNVQAKTPLTNIIAILDAVKEFNKAGS